MRSAIVTVNEGVRETGETVLFVNAREVGLILAALEQYASANKRSKAARVLVGEFEMLPCKSPMKPKRREAGNA